MRAGAKLRAIRQQLGLSFRDVHAASLDVAKKHRQPAFVIPPRSSRAPVRNLVGIKFRSPMLMPGVAQPAIQEGKYVADVMLKR